MILCYAKAFRSDYKLICKRKWDVEKLDALVKNLILAKDGHMLKGQFKGKNECNVGFNWIVIYEISRDAIKLLRTVHTQKYSGTKLNHMRMAISIPIYRTTFKTLNFLAG